jgi:hypothetical protein
MRGELFCDANLMLPQVPEVILVQESLVESVAQVGEPDLGRVIRKPHPTGLRDAIMLPPGSRIDADGTLPTRSAGAALLGDPWDGRSGSAEQGHAWRGPIGPLI